MTATDWSPALQHLRRVDDKLAALIEHHGSPTLAPSTDAVRALARKAQRPQVGTLPISTINGNR